MEDYDWLATRIHNLENELTKNTKEVCEIKDDSQELGCLMESFFSWAKEV